MLSCGMYHSQKDPPTISRSANRVGHHYDSETGRKRTVGAWPWCEEKTKPNWADSIAAARYAMQVRGDSPRMPRIRIPDGLTYVQSSLVRIPRRVSDGLLIPVSRLLVETTGASICRRIRFRCRLSDISFASPYGRTPLIRNVPWGQSFLFKRHVHRNRRTWDVHHHGQAGRRRRSDTVCRSLTRVDCLISAVAALAGVHRRCPRRWPTQASPYGGGGPRRCRHGGVESQRQVVSWSTSRSPAARPWAEKNCWKSPSTRRKASRFCSSPRRGESGRRSDTGVRWICRGVRCCANRRVVKRTCMDNAQHDGRARYEAIQREMAPNAPLCACGCGAEGAVVPASRKSTRSTGSTITSGERRWC